jgi:O-antigen/teichoic acid export membrane protein
MTARSLKTNFAINVAGAIVPLLVSLVTVPIYIRHIGDARYGVLSIVWVLLGYFGFLDLGLSRAAANALARLRYAPQPDRARVLVTTLVLNLTMGLVGSLALALAGSYLLQHVLAVPDALKAEVAGAFPGVVVLLPLALVSGVANGALESRERFALANTLGVISGSLGQVIPVLLAVLVSPSLTVVIPAAALVRALSALAVLTVVFRSEGPLHAGHFDRRQIRELLRYGGWVSVTGVVGPILTSLDQFVIGSVLGVAKVPGYAVPMSLVLRSQIFPAALSRTLFPRLSSLAGQDAQALASRALSTVAFGYAVVCAPAIVATPLFFRLWISPEFAAAAAPVAEVLFLGAWVNAMAFVPYALLQSQGRPDVTGKFHALEVVPFVAVLWLLTRHYGIQGAAYAWALRCVVDGLMLFAAARMPRRDLLRSLVPLAVLLVSVVLTTSARDTGGYTVVVAALALATAGTIALAMVDDLRAITLRMLAVVLRTQPAEPLGVNTRP